MALTAELYELIVKVVEEKIKDLRVQREEFESLTKAISKLAEAQGKTEERVGELAEAQKKTEERVRELAKRVEELAEAQKKTEERVRELAEAIDALRVEVGRLSEVVGFGLEDVARVMLPGWLYRHLGIEVELERRFVEVDGMGVEVNLYGEGVREGRRVIVVGECKSRIYGGDVESFYRRVYRPIAERTKVEVVGVLFGYLIHPTAQQAARKLGLYTVASYMR